MATVYILYSQSIDNYNIGSCLDIEERFIQHLDKVFGPAFTSRADNWEIFLKIDDMEYQQARKIEEHIKKMKSRVYINNLVKYPDIIERLKQKF